MALALDIITVVVFIALISKGAAKGFLSALSELAGLIVSVAAAAVFCQPFGSFIYSHFLKDAVLRAAQSAAAAELAGVDSALAKLAGTYAGAKNAAVADAAASAGLLIGRVAAFAIILIVCLIVAGLIAHAFRGVNRLPVLGGLNRLAGAVLGAVTAALVMFVLSAAISALMPLSAAQKNHAVITASTIDSTYVFKYIYQADPLDKMLLK